MQKIPLLGDSFHLPNPTPNHKKTKPKQQPKKDPYPTKQKFSNQIKTPWSSPYSTYRCPSTHGWVSRTNSGFFFWSHESKHTRLALDKEDAQDGKHHWPTRDSAGNKYEHKHQTWLIDHFTSTSHRLRKQNSPFSSRLTFHHRRRYISC